MDTFLEPLIAEAEARHSRRRKRSGRIFGAMDHVFYWALLLAAAGVVMKFAQLIWPHVL